MALTKQVYKTLGNSAYFTLCLETEYNNLLQVLLSVLGQCGYYVLKQDQMEVRLADGKLFFCFTEWVRNINLESDGEYYPRFHLFCQYITVIAKGEYCRANFEFEIHVDEKSHQSLTKKDGRNKCRNEVRRLERSSSNSAKFRLGANPNSDPLRRLRKFCEEYSIPEPIFNLHKENQTYSCHCQTEYRNKLIAGYGTGDNQKKARQKAAMCLLENLRSAVRT